MRRIPKPTEAEIQILRVLWSRGPSTVREVFAESKSGTGYTTALKLMQIMADKGLVKRDQSNRAHVYRAALPETQTLIHLAGDLLDRAFEGSTRKLLMAALSARRASAAELEAMRHLIAEAEKQERNPS